LLYLYPRALQPRVAEVWNTLYHELSSWLKAQTISIGITMALVYVLLGLWLELPFALVVAVFAGVATFIPNIGAFLPVIPILIFGLASPTPERILIWLAVYLLIQLAESNFITPSVVKNQLQIPAGAMMVFQLIATVIFGALGLLLAVPLFAVIIVLVRELYSYDTLGLRTERVVQTVAATSPTQSPHPQIAASIDPSEPAASPGSSLH
jgi:predicted PurR-regulated permease PerM